MKSGGLLFQAHKLVQNQHPVFPRPISRFLVGVARLPCWTVDVTVCGLTFVLQGGRCWTCPLPNVQLKHPFLFEHTASQLWSLYGYGLVTGHYLSPGICSWFSRIKVSHGAFPSYAWFPLFKCFILFFTPFELCLYGQLLRECGKWCISWNELGKISCHTQETLRSFFWR